jgi:hypothetical protein
MVPLSAPLLVCDFLFSSLQHARPPTYRSIVRQFDAWRARNPRGGAETRIICPDCRKPLCARGVEPAQKDLRADAPSDRRRITTRLVDNP